VSTLGAPNPQILRNLQRISNRIFSPLRNLIRPRRTTTQRPIQQAPRITVPPITFSRVETPFGDLVLQNGARNAIPQEEKDIYLPVMKALLKVMESNTTAPEDVNNLLVLTRDLTKDLPEEATNLISSFDGLEDSFKDGLEGIVIPDIGDGVLPEDGDIIVQFKDSPYIVTQFGAFPLSEMNLMTDDERELLLPVTRNFISAMENDNVSQEEIEELVEQSKILNDLIPEQFRKLITASIDKELNGVAENIIEA